MARIVAAIAVLPLVAPVTCLARPDAPSHVRAPAVAQGLYTAHVRVAMAYPIARRRGTIDIRLRVSRDGTRFAPESYVALDVPCGFADNLELWNLDGTGVPDEPGQVNIRPDGSFSTVGRVEWASGGTALTLGMEGQFSFTQVSGWLRHRNFSDRGKVTCTTGLIHWKARLHRSAG